MNPTLLRVSSVILALLLIAVFVLCVLTMVSWLFFWIITVLVALFAYVILPKMKAK